jgi:NAD(P)H-hydrate epimerase
MKVFSCNQIQQIDKYTIVNEPIMSIDLMERASIAAMEWISRNYPYLKLVAIFSGPGNNGGDGIAIARLLLSIGFNVKLYILDSDNYSEDNRKNQVRLIDQGLINPIFIKSNCDLPSFDYSTLVIDCLFGSGLTRPLTGLSAQLVNHINKFHTQIVSIDIPSGLFGEENPFPNTNVCIKAKTTITFQFPKLSFFMPENLQFVGNWEILEIGLHKNIVDEMSTQFYYIDNDFIKSLSLKRNKFDHKGKFGHSLIIAGSYGMFGAAVLATQACIRSGVGLLTVHVPSLAYSTIQETVPEAIVSVDISPSSFSNISSVESFSSIGIGPGMGMHPETIIGFKNLITKTKCPLVIDADGINVLAQNPDLLYKLPKYTIITPHVGEFDRLFGRSVSSFQRLKLAIVNASKYNLVIVIKGAHSQIVCPDGRVFFNSSGNPGMATAGSGDVLTGIITSLVGQGLNQVHAAIMGVYMHGKAGDLAAENGSKTILIASDIVNNIAKAFKSF